MCEICDGATWEEVLLRKRLEIESVGWSLTSVDGGPGGTSWTYTVGLTLSFGHPELVVTGVRHDMAGGLLDLLSELVSEGDRFDDATEFDVGRGSLRFVSVHPAQLKPTFANWVRYYDARTPPPELRGLQVVVPDDWFCGDHPDPQPLLNVPSPVMAWQGMNRSERRAVGRRRAGASRPRHW